MKTCSSCIYYGIDIDPSWCKRHGEEKKGNETCDSYEETPKKREVK